MTVFQFRRSARSGTDVSVRLKNPDATWTLWRPAMHDDWMLVAVRVAGDDERTLGTTRRASRLFDAAFLAALNADYQQWRDEERDLAA